MATVRSDLVEIGLPESGAGHDVPVAETPPPPPPAVQTPPRVPLAPVNIGLPPQRYVKESKTADELAAMILIDLRKVKGCPPVGVTVTVYGSNPWNCWLHFGGAAGPLYKKTELQEFCDIITDRLKRLYDAVP